MGFRIFRILNKRQYLVYLWGGPLLFWKLGDENFSKTDNFFFCIVVCENIFFFRYNLPADNFFMPAKNLVGFFFAFANKFFRIFPQPPYKSV